MRAPYLHVVRQNPQPGEEVLQKYVNSDELEICTQKRFVVAGIRARNEQSVPTEDERVVLADVIRRLTPTEKHPVLGQTTIDVSSDDRRHTRPYAIVNTTIWLLCQINSVATHR